MGLASMIGLSLIADYTTMRNLIVDVSSANGQAALDVQGEIMASALVFKSMSVHSESGNLYLTIRVCLPVWNRAGNGIFHVTQPIHLPPGTYNVQYVNRDQKKTFIKKIQL